MRANKHSVSIVSHGQGHLVSLLLDDIERVCADPPEIVVVLNIPEDERYLGAKRGFPVSVQRNVRPRGFGANHNAAQRVMHGRFCHIVNPDIRLESDPFQSLATALLESEAAIVGPLVKGPSGEIEDSARKDPTALRVLMRRVGLRKGSDYATTDRSIEVDWVGGMFMTCRRTVYAAIGGFDERYFMYFEDADLCRRARARGDRVIWSSEAFVIHHAQRASHKDLKHFAWHARSAIRYLTS